MRETDVRETSPTPEELLALAASEAEEPALGHDPFADLGEPDPFLERLGELELARPARLRSPMPNIIRMGI